jgi:hypothetical protein
MKLTTIIYKAALALAFTVAGMPTDIALTLNHTDVVNLKKPGLMKLCWTQSLQIRI